MKKLIITSALICASLISFGQGITGSAHDFSGDAWNTTGQICIVCHTPHHGDLTVADAPLWNHEVTAATYTLYSSPTLDATMGQPDNNSKLCLSCHDGTVALDSFGGATGGTNIGGSALIGTDLSNHHPVTFLYDDALATTDGGLHVPSTATTGLGGTIQNDLLFSDSMECGSCHDVHDDAGNTRLLVISNAASALCLTCHNK